MSVLSRVIPVNLLEEKAHFLMDHTYNPQFTYEEPSTLETLTAYGLPQKKYLSLAQEILDRAYFGRNEADLLMSQGKKLTESDVTEAFEKFLDMHGLKERFEIIWSSSFVSRASIDSSTIKLRTNAEFREEGLIGLIYHEVGTHAIRRINYEHQPWYKKKKQYGLTTDYLRTEEGLAALHNLFPQSIKLAYTSAIRYLAVEYAQHHSLIELWEMLGTYIQDPETRWMVTFRQKRGMTDTSKPGGFSKDLVYFEGLVETWRWLAAHDFDITNLYQGKIAFEDVDAAVKINPEFQPLLPSFFSTNHNKYRHEIQKIGEENQFNFYQD